MATVARRYPGKPFALALGTFLIVGTALTTYFAWRNPLAQARAQEQIEAADGAAHP